MTDHQKRQVTAKELARLEKQRKLAQTLRLKEEADANGEDMERRKAWEWSIEQDERWKKKMDEREERSDNRYHSMSFYIVVSGVFCFQHPQTDIAYHQTPRIVHTNYTTAIYATPKPTC